MSINSIVAVVKYCNNITFVIRMCGYFFSIGIHQFNWIPRAIGIRTNARILVGHGVDGKEETGEVAVVVPRAEVGVPCFGVTFLAGESERVETREFIRKHAGIRLGLIAYFFGKKV